MFCVIYEFKVKPGTEPRFMQTWHKVTAKLTEEGISLGARLHKSDEGSFVAYAQWSDRESWLAGHKIIEKESEELHVDECLAEAPSILRYLTPVDDLLVQESCS